MTDIQRGRPYPLGATFLDGGVNFSVFSKNAELAELCLFDAAEDARPSRVIQLDPDTHRTAFYWHVFVEGLENGQLFGWRMYGPYEPAKRHRFDGQKLLLDPYALGVAVGDNYDRGAATRPGDNAGHAMKSVIVDRRGYDWEGDEPLESPYSDTVIYEMHVGGFTQHESSGLSKDLRGTYKGLIEKIPYLQSLGISAVELLPVYQYDEQDCPPGLSNYWGYAPVSFFAPHMDYSSVKDPLGAINEFRDMVKALHRAGIEVILDVVYNHTAEGDSRGPTFCFRGFENAAYYILEESGAHYSNYSGTGNTLNANHSVVRRLIRDSLRHWVQDMHVDGFRFDLASILTRDESGQPLKSPPLVWSIESDPVLAGTKIIAEAWDAAGLYQVGNFVGDRWTEWNGQFRDDVRSFVKGDRGGVRKLPPRLLGSPDLYGTEQRGPEQSINFVTCHDGFTLNDLVSYNHKHNDANLEDNRDGSNNNLSWNCGVEGPTDDPDIEALRHRQVKNFMTILMLSLGTPMINMGDEVRRTQLGNNNVYCQDNELSWFDWRLVDKHPDLLRFIRGLIRIRRDREFGMYSRRITLAEMVAHAGVVWHGVRLNEQHWSDHDYALAVTARNVAATREVHAMFNSWQDSLDFELPPVGDNPANAWHVMVDTYKEPPDDIVEKGRSISLVQSTYEVGPRSVVILRRTLPHSMPVIV